MGGVDRLSQVRKSYGFDRKSRRYWVRAFFDYAINNAYLLYKHNCRLHDMTPRDLQDIRIDLMKLLIRPGKHRYRPVVPRSPSLGGSVNCSLCHVGEVGLCRRKCRHCMGNTSTTSYHLCLLLLQRSSLRNLMFCRLPQELKFFIINLFTFIFLIPSPLISLYSNLENYVFAHFSQLCGSFCRGEWLQLFKSVKT